MNTSKCSLCDKTIIYNKWTNTGKFCDNKCQAKFRTNIQNESNKKLLLEGRLTLRSTIKKTLLYMGKEHKCDICGITDWLDKPISMVLDHINGKANDNSIDNLRFLCHNCDSQSDHYKGRNKGNGRKSLGLI